MNPIDRIFTALLLLYGLVGLLGLFALGNLGGFVFVPLAATIGPFMEADYSFPEPFKTRCLAALLVSIAAMIYGMTARRHVHGQVAVVCGVLLWTIVGFIGLGTGT